MKNSYYRYFVVDRLVSSMLFAHVLLIYDSITYMSSKQLTNAAYCLILSDITLLSVIQLLIMLLIVPLIQRFLNIFYFNIKHLAKIFV